MSEDESEVTKRLESYRAAFKVQLEEEEQNKEVLADNSSDIPSVIGTLAQLQAQLLSYVALIEGDLEWGLIERGGRYFLTFQDSQPTEEKEAAICDLDIESMEVEYYTPRFETESEEEEKESKGDESE